MYAYLGVFDDDHLQRHHHQHVKVVAYLFFAIKIKCVLKVFVYFS